MKFKKTLDWALRILLFGLIVFGVVLIIRFFRPHEPNAIPEGAVSMDFPLKDGSYLINFSGPGDNFLSGPVHQSPNEKYALDITKTTSINIKDIWASLITHNAETNSSFGTPIYSPCYGNVKVTSNDKPDMPIGKKDPVSGGNYVLVGCEGFNVTFAHMKKGSVVVKEGQIVRSGDLLGQIGNSGNSSGPHLHLMAARVDQNDNVTPLPMIFKGRYLVQSDIFEN